MINVWRVFEGLQGGYLPNTVITVYGINDLRFELAWQREEHYTDFDSGQKQYELHNTVKEIISKKYYGEMVYISDSYNYVGVQYIGKFSKKQIKEMKENSHD